jgi:diguanylate cyclase (GGDEF)-like protein
MLRRTFAAMALLASLAAAAADWRSGKPLTNVFRLPGEFAAQVFTIAQGRGGAMYVGGTFGLHRFDGTRWLPIAVPGRLVRTLRYDGERLWVGGYNAFGYVERERDGTERFVDFAPLFQRDMGGREIADLWSILVRPEAIYFRGLNDLFAIGHDGARLGYWRHDGRFGSLAEWDGKVLAQFRGEGLKVLEGGKFAMLRGSEALADTLVQGFYPAPGGNLLVHLATGFRLWTREGLKSPPWNGTPPRTDLHTQGTPLPDGRIVFGGVDGMVRVVDFAHSQEIEMPVSPSRVSVPVIDAVDGSIWVGDAQGLYRMSWPPRWQLFDQDRGLRGNVYRVREAPGRIFAATGAGLFEARINARGEASGFERRDWAEGEAWDIVADGERWLLADSLSLKEVHDGRVRLISGRDLYPRIFVPSRVSPRRVWIGLEHGVARAEMGPKGWELAARYPLSKTLVQSIVELEGGRELLLGTPTGAVRLTLKDEALEAHAFESLRLGESSRPQGNDPVLISRVGESIVASSVDGFFRWEGQHFVPAVGNFDTLRAARTPFELTVAPDGALWAASAGAAFVRPLGSERWEPAEINTFRRGLLSPLTITRQGVAYAGDAGTVFRFMPSEQAVTPRQPVLRVSGIELRTDDGGAQRLPLDAALEMPPSGESISIELSFDDYARFDPPIFQARLTGLERRFSQPTERPVFTFGRLPPGNYGFEAMTRDGAGRQHRLGPIPVAVPPRWHEMTAVRLGGAIAAILALAALVLALARRRTRRLDALVAQRTRELESANAQLEDLAMRDGLTGVRNRRHFDETLARIVAEGAGEGRQLALMMADVDHFKRFNDTRGHVAGDELLRRVGRVLASVASDLGGHAARYGGEEFVVLLPNVTRAQALAAAERVRMDVSAIPDGVTISIGVAHGVVHREAARRMVSTADEALYRAKAQGRDRVVVADHSPREVERRPPAPASA